ncbi:MAG: hypothetical protein M1814_006786 [Vezdaea aestivalis]|nr:MAG: hypothetical protein M1814_006786 [Vezdaea aestivalis]
MSPSFHSPARAPSFLVIGAGSRGNAYSKAVVDATNGKLVAVAEPDEYKRIRFGHQYIWGDGSPQPGQSFEDWRDFIKWETKQRQDGGPPSVDGVFVCVLDELHAEVVIALAPLKLHIMCEKPLATNLDDCVRIFKSLDCATKEPETLFSICHVLRYSPHNVTLRKLLLEEKAIGDVLSIEHTEPVGWWHFSHSYVRGNWRKESKTAPSLLTKSCHDIDLLLWLLCSPGPNTGLHLPDTISSSGSLAYFKQSRKPKEAGSATNCLSCAFEPSCMYSAKKIYHDRFMRGDLGWPVKIVLPDLEDTLRHKGVDMASQRLLNSLSEDYNSLTPQGQVDARPWFGRCVYEAANDVCDDQVVTMTWDDNGEQGSKSATFHMVAFTDKICERRSRIYGTRGEIEADSTTITVLDFPTGRKKIHRPKLEGGGHGGGDGGLVRQFVKAVEAVMEGSSVSEAQRTYIGCDIEEIIRSHAVVFAAEEARLKKQVLSWDSWWEANVSKLLV